MVVAVQESDHGTKKKLEDALKRTKRKIDEGKEIREELNKILRKIRDDARIFVPKDTWTLHDTIRVSSVPTGILGGFSKIKTVQIFDRAIIAGDVTKINPKTGRPCDYAMWVHDGHRMPDGKFYAGVPFLTMALAKNSQELDNAIDRALKKLGKDFSIGD
jgi:hypothetical protein